MSAFEPAHYLPASVRARKNREILELLACYLPSTDHHRRRSPVQLVMNKLIVTLATVLAVAASASAGEVDLPPAVVPEGGATLALLGLGLASVIALKRRLTRNEH